MGVVNKVTNMKYNGKSNITMMTTMLIFYLLIANNHLQTLYSGQLTNFIQNNRYAQHMIAFITMLVIIIMFAGVRDLKVASFYAVVAYSWFILTTKIGLEWNLLILLALLFGFFYENNIFVMEKEVKKDEALSKEERRDIIKKNRRIKKILVLSIISMTLIGTTVYGYSKYDQYGGDFNVADYLLKEGNRYR